MKKNKKLSSFAINFLKDCLLPNIAHNDTIDNGILTEAVQLATEWELNMLDAEGNEKDYDYPNKLRNENAEKFVSEVTGIWTKSEIDLTDLNEKFKLL